MSFSAEVRNELARLPVDNPCCRRAELTALLRAGGALTLGDGQGPGISFTTETASVARRVLALAKREFGVRCAVSIRRSRRLNKHNSYVVRIAAGPEVSAMLAALGIVEGADVPRLTPAGEADLPKRPCCRRAFLRGAFLGGGSVNRPEGEYHLEIVTENAGFAAALAKVSRSLGLRARLTSRKHGHLVYFKDGETITSFLRLIGAHAALLEFENVRVVKDVRNQVNRLVNCETANLEKTINAGLRQVEGIKFIAAKIGLDRLPPPLRRAAEVRLAFPDATLKELAEAMDDRVGKSGLNHRLRKLAQIAAELRTGGNDESRT